MMADRFPQEAVLRDGRHVLIRRFTGHDTDDLYNFFHRLPPEVRRLAWDNIEDRSLIDKWGRDLDYGKVLPLLALDREKVVADATLHRRDGGPLRMVGRVRWLLDPDYRRLGLGITLVNNFINVARDEGLRHLTCMLDAEAEADAVETLEGLGFARFLIPGYGFDPDGNAHDMVKLVLAL